MKKTTLEEKRRSLELRGERNAKLAAIRDPRAQPSGSDSVRPYDSESLLERGVRTADKRAASLHRATKMLFEDGENTSD